MSILPDAVELQNLINILSSEVSEEFAARFREPAEQLFFLPKEESTLYFKWEISDQILSRFADIINRLPDGATSRRIAQWLISRPTFVAKSAQRITWESRVTLVFEGLRPQPDSPATEPPIGLFGSGGLYTGSLKGIDITGTQNLNVIGSGLRLEGGPYTIQSGPARPAPLTFDWRAGTSAPPPLRPFGRGTDVFSITWSVSISEKTDKLVNARLNRIEYVESTWKEAP